MLSLFALISLKAMAPEKTIEGVYYEPVIKEIPGESPFDVLWRAVCMVESSNNPRAYRIEKNGLPSIGIAQIMQIRLDDYNWRTKSSYQHDDCYDPDISKEIFMYYTRGRTNIEKVARAWNGSGPATDAYWRKVKKYLTNDLVIPE